MINAISAADIAFIMSSSTSAWLPSPLECSPNGGSAVRTHRAMLQLQGHGSQERPVKQVTAAHAPESGQGGKDLSGQLQLEPVK